MIKESENIFDAESGSDFSESRRVWADIFEKHPMDFYRRVRELELRIKKQFPDYINYEAYHVLNGTSVNPSFALKKEDFPGMFSIKKFLFESRSEFSDK